MRLFLVSSLLGASFFATTVHADESGADGYYARFFGAYASLDETDYRTNLGRIRSEFDDGFVVGGAAGLETNWLNSETTGLRLEFEYAYRENDVDDHELRGIAQAGSSGEFSANTFMTNLLFDMFKERPVSIYFGGGLGIAFTDFENFTLTGTELIDDDDAVFAYQGIAGVEYTIDERWSLFGEYRYFGMEDADVTLSPAAGGSLRQIQMDSHNFGAGLRLRF